jgi:hypothetical protein
MEGEYVSVEPDGHLTTNINWGQKQNYAENICLYDFKYTLLSRKHYWDLQRERE